VLKINWGCLYTQVHGIKYIKANACHFNSSNTLSYAQFSITHKIRNACNVCSSESFFKEIQHSSNKVSSINALLREYIVECSIRVSKSWSKVTVLYKRLLIVILRQVVHPIVKYQENIRIRVNTNKNKISNDTTTLFLGFQFQFLLRIIKLL